jgi:hypothetical protein
VTNAPTNVPRQTSNVTPITSRRRVRPPARPVAPVIGIASLRTHEGTVADARALLGVAMTQGVTAYTRRDCAHKATTFAQAAILSLGPISETAEGTLRARAGALVLEADAIWKQGQAVLCGQVGGAAAVIQFDKVRR